MLQIERKGQLAIARFDRGDGKNALSLEALAAFRDAFEGFAREAAPPTALLITGAAGVFSVGFDLKDPAVKNIDSASVPDRLRGPMLGAAACKALAVLDCYTIVAVEGWCLGGGLALAASADLVIAGEGAKFGLPEVDRGMNLSWSSVPRLMARAGPAAGKRIALLGEIFTAEQTRAMGIIDEVVPSGEAAVRGLALAELAASKPPLAVRMIKRGANAYLEGLVGHSAALDAEQFALMTMTEDFKESLKAFTEKRPPKYKGR